MRALFAALQLMALVPLAAAAEICSEKNILCWQAFTPGGESDFSARHQQVVLKKKCPAIDTVIQYKPGAGGAIVGVENWQTLVTSCRIPQRTSIGRR